MEIRKVGVLGCGLMGSGIAQVAATAGYDVVVFEVAQRFLDRGFAGIAEAVIAENYDPVDIVTELINRAAFALEIAEAEGGNKTHALAPQSQLAVAGQ